MKGGKRPGSGRPAGTTADNPRRVRFPVRWTEEEQRLIEQAAKHTGKSASEIIRDATMEWIFSVLSNTRP